MDLRVVAANSAGQEGLDSQECSAAGHYGLPSIIIDYGQQLGLCGRDLIEHPDRHVQDRVPYERFVVLEVLLFYFLLKQEFKFMFLEDRVSEYAEILKTLKFLMLPTG